MIAYRKGGKRLLLVALLAAMMLWPLVVKGDGPAHGAAPEARISLPLVGIGTMDVSAAGSYKTPQKNTKTIKLYAGDMKPKGAPTSIENLGCRVAYNWDWPSELALAADAGIDVWPLVQTTTGSLKRIVAWGKGHPVTHIMIENEPFNQKQMSANTAARRIVKKILPQVDRHWPDARRVIGGFFIEQPGSYADIRVQVRHVVEAIQQASPRDDDVIAFHLYLKNAPAMQDVPAAVEWFEAQIDQIAEDWPSFAITEWGVLHASYSGKDIAALSAYMRATWEIMLERGCYAAAWYMAAANADASAFSDFVLTWENGALKELGYVYRDLPESIETEGIVGGDQASISAPRSDGYPDTPQ